MSNTYTWNVQQMFTISNSDVTDYVVNVVYRISGSDGTFNASFSSVQSFDVIKNQPNYIPYEDLTEEIVIGWIQSTIGENQIQNDYACIDGLLNSMANPEPTPSVTPLPWETN